MSRTGGWTVAIVAVLGGGAGWLLQSWISTIGRPVLSPPLLLSLVLAVAGVVVVAVSWRIRRAVRATVSVHVDPEFAVRVVALAKASSYAGALFVGGSAAFVLFLAVRPIVPVGPLIESVLGVVAAGILLAGGLVAEFFCVLPPDGGDDSDPPSDSSNGPEAERIP